MYVVVLVEREHEKQEQMKMKALHTRHSDEQYTYSSSTLVV